MTKQEREDEILKKLSSYTDKYALQIILVKILVQLEFIGDRR